MPRIYLSPSVAESNEYVGGGNEEYYMNLIADAMVPYLVAAGIDFTRNNPDDTLQQVIQRSNAEYYDLHLALRSNTSPIIFYGTTQGSVTYYFTFKPNAMKAANIIGQNMKLIYPDPELVSVLPSSILQELNHTRAISVLVSFGYNDNNKDAQWIRENIYLIARNIVLSLTDYFEMQFQFDPAVVDPNRMASHCHQCRRILDQI